MGGELPPRAVDCRQAREEVRLSYANGATPPNESA
jgi:hypothetical protein